MTKHIDGSRLQPLRENGSDELLSEDAVVRIDEQQTAEVAEQAADNIAFEQWRSTNPNTERSTEE